MSLTYAIISIMIFRDDSDLMNEKYNTYFDHISASSPSMYGVSASSETVKK